MIVIVVPACNESKNLKTCVKKLLEETSRFEESSVIVIAEDGSTDGTDQIAQELEKMYPQVMHLHSPNKLGKGLAIMRAFARVKGDIYAFIDCDLATSMKFFPKLIQSIKDGYDLALGSRYLRGAEINRVLLRDITSRLYNSFIRFLFRDDIFDHQIGFKAFSNRLIKEILNECDSKGWFWDTEIIVRSKKRKYRILEFPVKWTEKYNGSSQVKMVINVGLENIVGIFNLALDSIRNENHDKD